MTQRFSGYARHDTYNTPGWVTQALLDNMTWPISMIWEPAAGEGKMVRYLKSHTRVAIHGTDRDFFSIKFLPKSGIDAVVTNPPYGLGGKTAMRFIEHALSFEEVRTVAMLLQVDFDSGKTRAHLFRNCPHWAMKVILLRRIIWFEVPGKKPRSSTNHAWYVWRKGYSGPARITYAE